MQASGLTCKLYLEAGFVHWQHLVQTALQACSFAEQAVCLAVSIVFRPANRRRQITRLEYANLQHTCSST